MNGIDCVARCPNKHTLEDHVFENKKTFQEFKYCRPCKKFYSADELTFSTKLSSLMVLAKAKMIKDTDNGGD